MPVTSTLDKFRLELGDIDEDAPLLNDDEAEYFIAAHPTSLLLAVAAAADSLAARFAREFDVAEDGQKFDLSQKFEHYTAIAARFGARGASEVAAAADGAGMPIGRVPARTATTWAERH